MTIHLLIDIKTKTGFISSNRKEVKVMTIYMPLSLYLKLKGGRFYNFFGTDTLVVDLITF